MSNDLYLSLLSGFIAFLVGLPIMIRLQCENNKLKKTLDCVKQDLHIAENKLDSYKESIRTVSNVLHADIDERDRLIEKIKNQICIQSIKKLSWVILEHSKITGGEK